MSQVFCLCVQPLVAPGTSIFSLMLEKFGVKGLLDRPHNICLFSWEVRLLLECFQVWRRDFRDSFSSHNLLFYGLESHAKLQLISGFRDNSEICPSNEMVDFTHEHSWSAAYSKKSMDTCSIAQWQGGSYVGITDFRREEVVWSVMGMWKVELCGGESPWERVPCLMGL